jgi:O-antigen ligase
MAIVLVVIIFCALLAGGGYSNASGLLAASAGMGALFIFGFFPKGRGVIGAFKGLGGPGLLFAVVVMVAGVQIALPATLDRAQGVVQLLRLLGVAAVFLAAVTVARSARSLKTLTTGLTIAGLAFVAAALVLYALRSHTSQDAGAERLEATFTRSPNTAAAVIGFIALVALGGLLQRIRRLPAGLHVGRAIERILASAWLDIATLGLSAVTLGLTGSRSGMVLILLCALALVAWSRVRTRSDGRGSAGIQALGLLAGVALLGVGASVTFVRLPALGGDAAARTQIYQAHWPKLFDQPLIGHGLGSFVITNRALTTPDNVAAVSWVADMHNVFMQWIEEAGFLGAGAMFGCIGWILVVIVRGAGRVESSRTWLKTAAAASLFLILQGMVEIALQYEGAAMLWAMLLGSAFGLATSAPRRSASEEPRRR